MGEWISVKDRIPIIDYDNNKSVAYVAIKFRNGRKSFAHFREIYDPHKKKLYAIFYHLYNGKLVSPAYWMPCERCDISK